MTEKEPIKQWISFSPGTETYAHPIDSVREIAQNTPPVPVPGTAREVEGVLNVRGEVVPVLDGGRALLNPRDEEVHDDDWRLIILGTPSGLLGLRVDAVRKIVAFSEAAIEGDTKAAFTVLPDKGADQGHPLPLELLPLELPLLELPLLELPPQEPPTGAADSHRLV